MNPTLSRRTLPLTLTLLTLTSAVVLSGCAGTPKPATADAGEYEWVTPTGSNIAVRVPKGQRATVDTSPTAALSGEQGAAMINGAGGKVPVDRGGR